MKFPLKDPKICGYDFGAPTHYNDFHLGVDYCAQDLAEQSIRATQYSKKVLWEGWGPVGGWTIHVLEEHPKYGWCVVRHLHMKSRALLKVGTWLDDRDILGFIGTTGNSTMNHDHIDVSKNELKLSDRDNFIDPKEYYAEENVQSSRNVQLILLGNGEFIIPTDDVVSYYKETFNVHFIATTRVVSPEPEFLPQPIAQIRPDWIQDNLVGFFTESADYIIIITKKWHMWNGILMNNGVADLNVYNGKRTGHIRYMEGESANWGQLGIDRDLLFDSIIHELSHMVNMEYGRFGAADKTHEYVPDYLRAVREALETKQEDMAKDKLTQKEVDLFYDIEALSYKDTGRGYWVGKPFVEMLKARRQHLVDFLNK